MIPRHACLNCGDWIDDPLLTLCDACASCPLLEYDARTANRDFIAARNNDYHKYLSLSDSQRRGKCEEGGMVYQTKDGSGFGRFEDYLRRQAYEPVPESWQYNPGGKE